jgi:nucleoside-diphosphate-sugar epimerase
MKIVITGANGFVGAALCRYFFNLGHQVVATGRQATPNSRLLAYATYIQADISGIINPFDAEVCIHAAGLASDIADYDSLFLHNVTGTANVLEAAKSCRYLIFISSSSVYNFSKGLAGESDAGFDVPLISYGKTKLLAEELIKANIPIHQRRLILRPRAIYGTGDRVLLPRLLKLIKGKTILCPIAASVLTSATHVDNLAYAIYLFFSQPKKPALQLFNVADDRLYNLKDMVVKMLRAIDENLTLINIPTPAIKMLRVLNSKFHLSNQLSPVAFQAIMENSILDLTRIKETLGYHPPHIFDDSFKEIGEWVNHIGGIKAYLNALNDLPWLDPGN